MGIYVATKIGREQDNAETRANNVLQLSPAQYNAALVDETGTAFTATAAELNALTGTGLSAAELAYLDITTLGTGAASKAVVLDASGDYTYPATGTIVYPSSATLTAQSGSTVNIAGTFQVGGVAVTATAAELNKVDQTAADVYADGFLQPRVAQATWDFAVDGGAISAIDLGVTIPANSLIIGGLYDVQTTCTSAGDTGTGAISVASANDILLAVAIGTGTPFDQGIRQIIPATPANAVKTTSAAAITFTIAVAAFTAGKFTVHLFYIPTLVNV